MKSAIKEAIKSCDICQRKMLENISPPGYLEPLPTPDKVWEDVAMDFIERLPASNGYNSIWVIVCRLSKYSHFIALKHPYSAPQLAQIFIKEFVKLYGFSKSIVSDEIEYLSVLFGENCSSYKDQSYS